MSSPNQTRILWVEEKYIIHRHKPFVHDGFIGLIVNNPVFIDSTIPTARWFIEGGGWLVNGRQFSRISEVKVKNAIGSNAKHEFLVGIRSAYYNFVKVSEIRTTVNIVHILFISLLTSQHATHQIPTSSLSWQLPQTPTGALALGHTPYLVQSL